jgi:DNA-binding NtrC family response regulator
MAVTKLKNRILIVEDEKIILNTLSFVLENSGYDVTTSSTGKEALEEILLRKDTVRPVDLLILDMDLSDFSATRLLHEIKRRNVELPTVAIIGLVDMKLLDQANGNSKIVWIKKPFNPEDIIECVKDIVRTLK